MSNDMIVTRISIEMDGINPAKIRFYKGDDLIKSGEFTDFSLRQRHGIIPVGGIDGSMEFVTTGEDQITLEGTYNVRR